MCPLCEQSHSSYSEWLSAHSDTALDYDEGQATVSIASPRRCTNTIYGWMEGLIGGCGWMDGWMKGGMDGWRAGQIIGWMNGSINGWVYKWINVRRNRGFKGGKDS